MNNPTLRRLHKSELFRPARRFLDRCLVALFVVLPLMTANPLKAQSSSGTIEGRVQNAASGDYLNNARISLVGTNQVVFSDQTGMYRILTAPVGNVTLRVSYTGLDAQELVIRVEPGITARQDVNLTSGVRYGTGSETVQLDKFTVAATREMDAESLAINEQRYASNSKLVMAADAFGDVSEGNLGEFVKRMPGVNIANEAAGDALQISVRGFDPEFTPVSIDGNSIPSAATSVASVDRGIYMIQVNTNNVSRVEVIKSPIPSIPADFLGGSVNLISNSAFERSKPQLKLATLLQWSQFDRGGFSLGKSPGFMGHRTHKVRPGYDFSYINPVTKNFGFTLSSTLSDQFASLYGPIMTYEFAPANGGSEAAPYLRAFRTTDDPRETKRQSYAGNVDWRPWESLTLSLGYRNDAFDLSTYDNRLAINTGATPASFGADFTQGRTGAGSLTHQQIYVNEFGNTDNFRLSGKYQKNQWKVDFSGGYSTSSDRYSDIDNGAFRSAGTSIVSPTVRFEGVSGKPYAPRLVEVRGASGSVVDWTRLSNYRILNVSATPRNVSDDITSGNLNVRHDFMVSRMPGTIKVGGSHRARVIDRHAYTPTWTFVGADGVANTADNSAAPFVDKVYTQSDVGSGVPSDIEFPDLTALYALYRQHPEYFALVEPAAFVSKVANSERIKEVLTAAYVQGEIKLIENRLTLLAGVRFERTANTGVGRFLDQQAHLQRDASGKILRNANGTTVPITTNALEVAKLQNKERGLLASHSYSDFYPSLNAALNVTPELLLRLSCAQTLGRPNFNNVVPNVDVREDVATAADDDGRIVMRNTKLKPWTADNYEASIEYYFKSSGLVSVSVFRKNVEGAFTSQVTKASTALLAEYGLDSKYLNWDVTTTVNGGDTMRITGTELSFQQALTLLPSWARGVSVFANATFLHKDGPVDAFSSLYRKTANWGLRYSHGRIGLGLNWNYLSSRGLVRASPPDGVRFTKPGMTLDLNGEFRITPRVSLFYNARNITNALYRRQIFNSKTPAYSRPYQDIENGSKMSLGLRGNF